MTIGSTASSGGGGGVGGRLIHRRTCRSASVGSDEEKDDGDHHHHRNNAVDEDDVRNNNNNIDDDDRHPNPHHYHHHDGLDVLTWKKVEPQSYQRKSKRVRRFYKAQNLLIDRLQAFYRSFPLSLSPSSSSTPAEAVVLTDDDVLAGNACVGEGNRNGDDDDDGGAVPPRGRSGTVIGTALYASFALNVLLLIAKIVAAILSGSMSVTASAADSLLDLLSGTVLVVTHRLMNKSDELLYPQGKTRMEPVGVFAFAIIMLLSSLQIMIEAVRRLFSRPDIDMGPVTLSILGFTILSKAVMAWYCRRVADSYRSSAVEAYADDHRNDVLTNTVGVGAALAAYYVPNKLWSLDSVGAICIAIYIIANWVQTGREQLHFLTGRGASPMLLQQLTYIAARHDVRIRYVDTVRAYHFGVHYLVEVDIVLPEDMSLRESHDIGESLQHRLEQLDDVERAFVHNDYEWDHSPVVFEGTRIIRK